MFTARFAGCAARALPLTLAAASACLAGCAAPAGPAPAQEGYGQVREDNAAQGASASDPSGAAGTATATAAAPPAAAPACAAPDEGCPCDTEGATATCAGPKVHVGTYTSCAPGERLCHEHVWGSCVTPSVYASAGTLTQDYPSPCPLGAAVRWGALTLDGIAPAGSQINVAVQTADTAAGLDAAPVTFLDAFAGVQTSTWTSPAVDAVLASHGASSRAFLRVSVALVAASPGGAAPTVVDWRQASACSAR